MTSNIIQGLVESIMNKIIFIKQKKETHFFPNILKPIENVHFSFFKSIFATFKMLPWLTPALKTSHSDCLGQHQLTKFKFRYE